MAKRPAQADFHHEARQKPLRISFAAFEPKLYKRSMTYCKTRLCVPGDQLWVAQWRQSQDPIAKNAVPSQNQVGNLFECKCGISLARTDKSTPENHYSNALLNSTLLSTCATW